MIEGIIVDGLIFSLLALGVFISFRILDFPDLTVDGSFATGAAIVAISITN
jgi:putative ABC transport system permease protein